MVAMPFGSIVGARLFGIVRKAVFNGHERKRLYKEAKEFLALRSKRKEFVATQASR